MSAPACSVLKFCIDQIELNPELIIQKPHYLEKLKVNLDRAFNIIDSFRSIIRKDQNNASTQLDQTHDSVIKSLLDELNYKIINQTIYFDPSLESLKLKMSQFDAVFLLDTIYRNLIFESITNENLELSIIKEYMDEKLLYITISSNKNSEITPKNSNELSRNLLNLQVITQQLHSIGGIIGPIKIPENKSCGLFIRVGLPLI